jgi:fructose-1,6-bisphosphatase-3
MNSAALQRHIGFLYERGGMYKIYNGNLLYHGCVPLDDDGNLLGIEMFGEIWKGREFFDMAETIARRAYYGSSKAEKGMDFMWYLRCGKNSPLCGRNTKSFEHAFIDDKDAHSEEKNSYYKYYYDRETCEMILREFGLDPDTAHIINGHTPVRTVKGELPIRAEGKLLVIDGGFCKNYHETTGIAGYTLIYNSHGLRLKAHHPFRSIDAALRENIDIHSDSEIVETEQKRRMVEDTDIGKKLRQETDDLRLLLQMYRSGIMKPRE